VTKEATAEAAASAAETVMGKPKKKAVDGYMRVTADQWSAVSLPQANGQREAPESAPGHSQGIVPTLRGIYIKHFLAWLGHWVGFDHIGGT
jgi:hypothetical protein